MDILSFLATGVSALALSASAFLGTMAPHDSMPDRGDRPERMATSSPHDTFPPRPGFRNGSSTMMGSSTHEGRPDFRHGSGTPPEFRDGSSTLHKIGDGMGSTTKEREHLGSTSPKKLGPPHPRPKIASTTHEEGDTGGPKPWWKFWDNRPGSTTPPGDNASSTNPGPKPWWQFWNQGN